jgi:hypothetical protein
MVKKRNVVLLSLGDGRPGARHHLQQFRWVRLRGFRAGTTRSFDRTVLFQVNVIVVRRSACRSWRAVSTYLHAAVGFGAAPAPLEPAMSGRAA